jgi:hypothetical protein
MQGASAEKFEETVALGKKATCSKNEGETKGGQAGGGIDAVRKSGGRGCGRGAIDLKKQRN